MNRIYLKPKYNVNFDIFPKTIEDRIIKSNQMTQCISKNVTCIFLVVLQLQGCDIKIVLGITLLFDNKEN